MQIISLALFVVATACLFFLLGGVADGAMAIVCWVLAGVYIVCICASMIVGRMDFSRSDMCAFVLQSLSAIVLVFLVAFSMFPVLVFAGPESIGPSVTLMSAGASELSLTYMTVILCIGLPFVLLYHVLIYRTFRGRVSIEAAE